MPQRCARCAARLGGSRQLQRCAPSPWRREFINQQRQHSAPAEASAPRKGRAADLALPRVHASWLRDACSGSAVPARRRTAGRQHHRQAQSQRRAPTTGARPDPRTHAAPPLLHTRLALARSIARALHTLSCLTFSGAPPRAHSGAGEVVPIRSIFASSPQRRARRIAP